MAESKQDISMTEIEAEDTAGDIFLGRLRTLVTASSDSKLRITTAIGCLEIVKQELYEQLVKEDD